MISKQTEYSLDCIELQIKKAVRPETKNMWIRQWEAVLKEAFMEEGKCTEQEAIHFSRRIW